jgi:hypothetical protein
MIHFLHNLALFWAKNAKFFAKFFGENILKIITSGHPVRFWRCRMFWKAFRHNNWNALESFLKKKLSSNLTKKLSKLKWKYKRWRLPNWRMKQNLRAALILSADGPLQRQIWNRIAQNLKFGLCKKKPNGHGVWSIAKKTIVLFGKSAMQLRSQRPLCKEMQVVPVNRVVDT